jgi:cysteine desulfurase
MAAVEDARESVAELIGADFPEEILFTSGSTEAANWVLAQHENLSISPFEHSAVREPALAAGASILANSGYELKSAPEGAGLVAAMTVNNETGALLQSPACLHHAEIFRDITQQAGKMPVLLDGVDYACLSAHKFYGPKGVGALYAADGGPLDPLVRGGEQERGLRGGTLNVAGIVGMGAAAKIAGDEMEASLRHVEELRTIVLQELDEVPDHVVNEYRGSQSPYILSVSFLGVEGEALVVEMDALGYAISSGAACSSRSNEPSHVLSALEISPDWIRGTVRLSFGPNNTRESAAQLARKLSESLRNLRRLQKSGESP